jgi:tetratricopeptide (TPR) repeat protein
MLKSGMAGQKITVSPQVLEVSGDKVEFEVKAQIPKKLTEKNPVYNLNFFYEYGGKQIEPLGKMRFAPGEFVYENGLPTITRQFSFTYTAAKKYGLLMARPEVAKGKNALKYGQKTLLAPGVITTSRLTVKANELWLAPDEYRKGISEPQALTFFFDEGSDELRDYLGTNMDALREFIVSNYPVQKVQITAGHSPEPGDLKKPDLAFKRARMLEKFFRNEIDVNSYANTNKAVNYSIKPVNNNWDRFLKQVQLSALSGDQVNAILDIVNGDGSFKEKTEQLSRLDSYGYLQLYIYPVLRYADMLITYSMPQKLDSEIYLLSKKIVENKIESDQLTEEELRYSASLTPLLSEKVKIYQAAAENTLKWQAFNNLGVVYVQMAQKAVSEETRTKLLKDAIVNLTYASHRNPTARLFYNLASAQQILGKNTDALRSYDYALKLGGPVPVLQQVFADKAALEIETGHLDEAAVSLAYAAPGYQTLMNKGLLYLLKNNYEDAATFYEQALEIKPNDPVAHYALAVIGARTDREETVMANLRAATRSDNTIVTRAIEDPEFRRFVKNPAFRNALK